MIVALNEENQLCLYGHKVTKLDIDPFIYTCGKCLYYVLKRVDYHNSQTDYHNGQVDHHYDLYEKNKFVKTLSIVPTKMRYVNDRLIIYNDTQIQVDDFVLENTKSDLIQFAHTTKFDVVLMTINEIFTLNEQYVFEYKILNMYLPGIYANLRIIILTLTGDECTYRSISIGETLRICTIYDESIEYNTVVEDCG